MHYSLVLEGSGWSMKVTGSEGSERVRALATTTMGRHTKVVCTASMHWLRPGDCHVTELHKTILASACLLSLFAALVLCPTAYAAGKQQSCSSSCSSSNVEQTCCCNTGQLRNSQRHGQGRMQYSNGDAYEGSWVKDCRHGSAKFLYANGDVFVGRFDNNRREGLGTIYMVSSISEQLNATAYTQQQHVGSCRYRCWISGLHCECRPEMDRSTQQNTGLTSLCVGLGQRSMVQLVT